MKPILFTFLSSFLLCLSLLKGEDTLEYSSPTSQQKNTSEDSKGGVSSNPGAVNKETGTGALGEKIGFKKDSGVRIGGLWIADINYLISGGVKPKKWSGDSLIQLELSLDTKKLEWWEGGLFCVEFLQLNARPTNAQAGTVQGYNGIPGPPPLSRSELYQYWYRQEFFDKKFILRIGKSVPIYDFNNVLRPLPLEDSSQAIPATSALIYTPIFVNSTLLGVLPGFYNSAFGLTATFTPIKSFYLSYGVYDGNLARGKQTGLRGPQFNGYYFHIAEGGIAWGLGKNERPGTLAVGAWDQTGKLRAGNESEKGAQGIYMFGSQRLWNRNPGIDNSGMIGLIQLGINNSKTLPVNKYLGLGLSFLGLTPNRPNDFFGCGLALAKLNNHTFERKSEIILQGYYQLYLFDSTYLEAVLSNIPKPGFSKHLQPAWAGTLRLIVLF